MICPAQPRSHNDQLGPHKMNEPSNSMLGLGFLWHNMPDGVIGGWL